MILIDKAEPNDIVKLINQSVSVSVESLNLHGLSDYFFTNAEGKRLQFSRKQAGELLGNIDGAEADIRKYYPNADENYQIVEGIISPVKITAQPHKTKTISIRNLVGSANQLHSYKVTDTGYIHEPHTYNCNSPMLFSWFHRLAKCGVVTYFPVTKLDTARLLVAIYKNEQKPPEAHDTLNRYLKPRIYISKEDPFTKALMCLSLAYKIGVGEDKAKKLSTKYSSLVDIAMATPQEIAEIEGIGKKLANRLLRAIGLEVSNDNLAHNDKR